MKKTFLTISLSFLFLGVSAQWNNTGDSKTTGNLSIGNTSSTTSQFTVNGVNGGKLLFNTSKDRRLVIEGTDRGTGGQFSFKLMPKDLSSLWTVLSLSEENVNFNTSVKVGSLWSGSKTQLEFSPIHIDSYVDIMLYRGIGDKILPFNGSMNSNTFYLNFGETDQVSARAFIMSKMEGGVEQSTFVFDLEEGKVGIGTDNPQNALDVNGTIRAKEVRVESGWADFVFKDDYKLPTLQEVKAHIDEHKHLPGIPSETEVKENGIGLADATTKLLQKVEELTLYAIQQQEIIDKLTKEVDELKDSRK